MVDIFALTEYGKTVASTALDHFTEKYLEAQTRCSWIWTIVSYIKWLFGYRVEELVLTGNVKLKKIYEKQNKTKTLV